MSHSPNTKRGTGSQRSNDDWIVELTLELIWAMFKAAGYLLWMAILFPALSVPAFISLTMTLRYGIGAGMLTAIGLGAGYGLWAALDAQSFESWIAQPVRQQFQMWWRYSRTWDTVCTLNGLTATPSRPHPHTASAFSLDRQAHRRDRPARGHRPVGRRLAEAHTRTRRRLAR